MKRTARKTLLLSTEGGKKRERREKKKALQMLKDIKGVHERVGWWLLQQGEKQHYFTVQIKGGGKAAYL